MLPSRDLREVVLAQREAGHAQVLARLGRAEVGRVARDAQDPLALAAAHSAGASSAPLERAEERVPLPVGGDAVDDLLDHVARLAEGGDDRGVRREVGRDLQAADAVAVDERRAGRGTARRPGSRTRAAARRGSRRRRRGAAACRKRPDATTTASNGSPSTVQPGRTVADAACRSGCARRPRTRSRRPRGRRGSARPPGAAGARPAPGSPRTRSSRGSCWCACPATRRCGRRSCATGRRAPRSPRTPSRRSPPRARALRRRGRRDPRR